MTYRNRISRIALAAVTFGVLSVSAHAQAAVPPDSSADRAGSTQLARVAQSTEHAEMESITSAAQGTEQGNKAPLYWTNMPEWLVDTLVNTP